MMQLLTLGLNHTTAGIGLRERVAFPAERVRDSHHRLIRRLSSVVPESAILSTCNRTEVYCATGNPLFAKGALLDWLADSSAIPAAELRPHLYSLPQHRAVRHAFRVASGLDSMVLGEPQILGQLKDAVHHARKSGALGTLLHQLFQRSFAVAKEVRSRTGVGTASVSIAAAAVRLVQRAFDDLEHARVLFVGAGEMIELAATHLAAHHPHEIVVANRTLAHAERLAKRFGARPMRLAELPDQLAQFDIVVSCTASSMPVITRSMVEHAMRERELRTLVMVDLAVPRDIEPQVSRLPGVVLHTLDDVGRVVDSGVKMRREAATQAETIIETRVESFMRWLAARDAVPLLRMIDTRADTLGGGWHAATRSIRCSKRSPAASRTSSCTPRAPCWRAARCRRTRRSGWCSCG
ncbi:MAG: glutamyl-tRNA reductase [Thiobacillaceae bacterium]|nr:glutamyl-tRNA reductase [Thiobacillaceae bacterium]